MTRRGHAEVHRSWRLSARRRGLLYALLAILLLSGVVWLVVHARTPEGALPSPIEPWAMKLHGAAAMLMIYAAGTLLHGHMLNAWRRHRNRLSGAVAAGVLGCLAVSGYGLYYFDGDALRGATQWLHWAVGLVLPPLIVWHIVLGRRRGAARALH